MAIEQSTERVGTGAAILEAALQQFYERGYHGASTRSIAEGAGIGFSTLFHHFPSKDAILAEIVNGAADAMNEDLLTALDGVERPEDRLVTAAHTMVVGSCVRQRESFVGQSEFRSLETKDYDVNREKRRAIQRIFLDIVREGVDGGEFSCPHPRDVARSLVLLNSSVALWFQPGQGRTIEDLAEVHVEMSLDLVNAAR